MTAIAAIMPEGFVKEALGLANIKSSVKSLFSKEAAAASLSSAVDPFVKLRQQQGVKLASIAQAAFVDELVKIAAEMRDFWPVEAVVDHITPEHEELLKQAGLGDILNRAKGIGSSAVGAIRNLGAGGAARRMQAAGQMHDLQRLTAPTAYKATPSVMAPMQLKDGPTIGKRVAYDPARVSFARDLARERADIEQSAAKAITPAATQDAVQLPTHSFAGQLKEMNPFAGMLGTFRNALQPAPFAAAY